MIQSLTWLECGTDHVGCSLRVEQAICTFGDCNTLLIPILGHLPAKFLGVGIDLRVLSLQPQIYPHSKILSV